MGKYHDLAELERDNLESMAAAYSRKDGRLVAWNAASWTFQTVDAWAGGRGIPPLLLAGDNVLVESRGYIRPGKVMKVGRKNVTVAYVTPGGIQEARAFTVKYGKPRKAGVTVVVVPKTELHGWDPQPRRG